MKRCLSNMYKRLKILIGFPLIVLLVFSTCMILYIHSQKQDFEAEVIIAMLSFALAIMVYCYDKLSREKESFCQLFNTQLSLLKHNAESNVEMRIIDNRKLIPLVMGNHSLSVDTSFSIFKTFCEYFKSNVDICLTGKLTQEQIAGISGRFCTAISCRAEYDYFFKSIYMCIRTIKKANVLTRKEKNDYMKTVADLLTSEQLFCYFINQIHFYNEICNEKGGHIIQFKNEEDMILFRESSFFKDLFRSRFYEEVQHKIPLQIRACFGDSSNFINNE